MKTLRLLIIIGVFCLTIESINAQEAAPIQCGDIVEDEFTKAGDVHLYSINLAAGDILSVSGAVIGQYLSFDLQLSSPVGARLGMTNLKTSPSIQTEALSARGTYVISAANQWGPNHGGIGVFTIYIGCTLRDGTVINPGDILQPTQPPPNPPTTFSGVGFPGLAPVDFSAVAKIPMIANVPMTGAVTADGNIILGYTLDAAPNDTLALSFTRLSGNLNLGLVVLSSDNKVVFQASLVTSSELTTTFTLPSAGQYTIGVFHIDLLPPATPEPTAFQLQATLNP